MMRFAHRPRSWNRQDIGLIKMFTAQEREQKGEETADVAGDISERICSVCESLIIHKSKWHLNTILLFTEKE